MRRTAAAVLGLALAVAACGNPGEGQETVRGVVLKVNGDLTSVESFVLRTDDGKVLEVVPATDGDFRFPLPHLHAHRRTLEPVLVELDRSVSPPLATAIRDADSPAWHMGGRTTPEHPDPPEPDHPPGSEPVTEGNGPIREDEPAHQERGEPDDGTGSGQDQGTGDDHPDPVPDNTTASTASPPSSTPSTGLPVDEDPEEAGGLVINLAIADGKLEGGARRESVQLGDTVTLRVSGNSNDEVHVHGYDFFVHLVEGTGELTFEASIPGVFEIELEGSHTLLVRMEVS